MSKDIYYVVENSGYERESDVYEANSLSEAMEWKRTHYTEDELDPFHRNCLHVMIRKNDSYEY